MVLFLGPPRVYPATWTQPSIPFRRQLFAANWLLTVRFESLLNVNTSRLMMCKFASRWTNMRLCIVTSSVVSFISLIILLLRDVLPTSYAGAALIYAFQVRYDGDRMQCLNYCEQN